MCLTVLTHTPQLPSREATPCPASLCPSISGPCAHRGFIRLTHGAQRGDSCRLAGHGLSPWARPCLDAQGQVRLTSRAQGSVSHLGTWHPTSRAADKCPLPPGLRQGHLGPCRPLSSPSPQTGPGQTREASASGEGFLRPLGEQAAWGSATEHQHPSVLGTR